MSTGPRILSDSAMWESPRWSAAVDTVYRFGASKWVNHPVLLMLRLLWRRGRYDMVLTTGTRMTLAYGLCCRLLMLEQRQLVAQLYLDERRGLRRLLWERVLRWVLRGVDGVIVYSHLEGPMVTERYGLPPERIRYVPYHTTVIEPEDLSRADGPIFAGGRNYRDYHTLVEAVRGLDAPVVIVCGHNQLLDAELPPNVTVYREIPWPRYIELLRDAGVVVVPLSSAHVPSGQVAFLEAMAYGKAVITTRAVGTIDYIRDGVDGLLYELGDAAGLRAALERLLGDRELRHRMGHEAYESVVEHFTFDRHVEAKLAAMRELAEPRLARAEAAASHRGDGTAS